MELATAHFSERDKIKEMFFKYGYCKVEKVFTNDDLKDTINEYKFLTDKLAVKWFQEGILSSSYDNLEFEKKLISIIRETGNKIYDHFRIYFNPPKGTTVDSPVHTGPGIFGLLTNPKLLDIVEIILGEEIYISPINVVRVKPPEDILPKNKKFHPGLKKTWWHQDIAIYNDDMSNINMLTVWIPLTDASKEMGCLEVVPFSHNGEISMHCATSTTKGIPFEELGQNRHIVEMKKGDIQIHHKKLQHSSLSNISNKLRFSFDLRYQQYNFETIEQKTGVLNTINVPGLVARSRKYPEREQKNWKEFSQLMETHRQLFMSLNWDKIDEKNEHFSSDHHFCL